MTDFSIAAAVTRVRRLWAWIDEDPIIAALIGLTAAILWCGVIVLFCQ